MNPSQDLAAEYSEAADAYARYWAPVIHPMALPLLSAMSLAGARRILDVGSGTGALWPLIRRAAPLAELWGVDRAEGMLRAGDDLLHRRVAVMDAEHLGLRAGGFDAALLFFVLFHIPEPVEALREIRATLRPGGALGVVVWGTDPGLPGGAIWAAELDHAQAAPDPRDPAVMRQALMDTPGTLAALLEEAGFKADRVWSRCFVHEWTVETLLATQTHCGLPSRRLRSLGAEARHECMNRVRARLGTLSRADLEYRVELIYGIAQRSA